MVSKDEYIDIFDNRSITTSYHNFSVRVKFRIRIRVS